ncbi:MAG: FadR/GntR family transcriptional regulator [Chloroflexota bacterium]
MGADTSRFERVQRTLTYEAIVDQFRHLIEEGELRPGDRLPPERELALTLSVSRATLREAFRVLENAGLVASKIGRGRFVAEPWPSEESLSTISQAIEESAVFDLLEVRRFLEVPMAGLAAERVTPEDLIRMEETLHPFLDSDPTGIGLDTGFHLSIAQAARNAVYRRFVSSELFLFHRLGSVMLSAAARLALSNQDHRRIFEAIRRRDRHEASAAMLRHIDGIEENLQGLLRQRRPVATVGPR